MFDRKYIYFSIAFRTSPLDTISLTRLPSNNIVYRIFLYSYRFMLDVGWLVERSKNRTEHQKFGLSIKADPSFFFKLITFYFLHI